MGDPGEVWKRGTKVTIIHSRESGNPARRQQKLDSGFRRNDGSCLSASPRLCGDYLDLIHLPIVLRRHTT